LSELIKSDEFGSLVNKNGVTFTITESYLRSLSIEELEHNIKAWYNDTDVVNFMKNILIKKKLEKL